MKQGFAGKISLNIEIRFVLQKYSKCISHPFAFSYQDQISRGFIGFNVPEKKDLDTKALNLGEAWHLYLSKLEEEAAYLTEPEGGEEEICACAECCVRTSISDFKDLHRFLFQASYEVMYEGYMLNKEDTETASDTLANDDNMNDEDNSLLPDKSIGISRRNDTVAKDDKVTENTVNIMKSILCDEEDDTCAIM